jgi:hypothetical protein
MIRLPENKQWRGLSQGNYFGELWQTRNIDLERSLGRITLSDKMRIHADDTDSNMSNLGVVTKFIRSNADATDRFYALCSSATSGGRMFETNAASPIGTWAEDTTTGVSTNYLDMEVHESANGEQRLFATREADIAVLNTAGTVNTWDNDWGTAVAGVTALTAANYHPLARLQRLLAVADGRLVHTIDKNDVASNSRLVFPFGYSCRWIRASSDRFWFGLTNNIGGDAKIIEWDGFSLTYNNEYDVVGHTPLTCFIVSNIPYVVTNYGYIYRYFGGSFESIQQFPLAEEVLPTINIVPNGVAVDRHLVYILANVPEDITLTSSRRFRSGIWVFNTKTNNLYHNAGIGAHKAAGTEPDFGQSSVSAPGALLFTVVSNTTLLIAGGDFYIDYTGTTREAIWRNVRNRVRYQDTGYNRGYFITTYLPYDEIEAAWQAIWLKFKRFVHTDNRIVLKARAQDPKVMTLADLGALTDPELSVQSTGEWATTTTFTSAVPAGVAVGDEVEVMTGNGAGCLFHVSTLSGTPDGTSSITVTVDEALPDLNGVNDRNALFRFDNWTKVGVISSTSMGSDKLPLPSQLTGEFIQLKVELRGFEVEIDEIIPVPKPQKQIKQA